MGGGGCYLNFHFKCYIVALNFSPAEARGPWRRAERPRPEPQPLPQRRFPGQQDHHRDHPICHRRSPTADRCSAGGQETRAGSP